MYENYWEALAEFYIAKQEDYVDWNKHIYCLCSRVIVGNAEPFIYADNTEVCNQYENDTYSCIDQLDNLHITQENISNLNKFEIQSINKISEKLIYVCELDCKVNLCLVQGKYKFSDKTQIIRIKNKSKIFDGRNIYLKTCSSKFDKRIITIVFECFVLKDKNFVDSLTETFQDNKKIVQYNLITPQNFYKIHKCDFVKSYKLLHFYKVFKYANLLLNTSLFQFSYKDYWFNNGEFIVWLSWILKYKNYINADYLCQLVDTVNQLHCSDKTSINIKRTVLNQINLLIKQKQHSGSEFIKYLQKRRNLSGSMFENCEEATNDKLKLNDYLATYLTPENESVWQYLWQNHYQEQYNNCLIFFKAFCFWQVDFLKKICLTLNYNLTLPNQSESLIPFENKTGKEMFKKCIVTMLNDLEKKCESLMICDLKASSNIVPLYGLYENYCNDTTDNINKDVSSVPNGFEKPSVTGLDQIKEVLKLIGFAFEDNFDQLQGEVTYKKKNIKYLNRHLRMNWAYEQRYQMTDLLKDNNKEIMEQDKEANALNEFTNDLHDLNDASNIKDCEGSNQEIIKNSNADINVVEMFESSFESSQAAVDTIDTVKQRNNRKRKRKKIKKSNLPDYVQNNPILKKYYAKRYRLFSKFDDGIILDEESWFSVTPEKIAKHLAERCRSDLIIDAFCGAGGNSIAFAFTCERVYAIDIDPQKIAMAKHNAKIYGVEDRIEFIVGDFFCIAERLFADVVFLSPPWGGPSYIQDKSFGIENIMTPKGGIELLETAKKISDNVAYYLPKNINTLQLAMAAGSGSKVEIEQNFLGTQLVAVTAYFGDLLKLQ